MQELMVGPYPECDAATIQGALDQLTPNNPAVVRIMPGVYHERLKVCGAKVTLIGLGQVTITAGAFARQLGADGQELGTFRTATVYVNGEDIHLANLTIENTAGMGPQIGQAMALFAEGQRLKFTNLRLLANQDTLCLGPLPPLQKNHTPFVSVKRWREYATQDYAFDQCTIAGTVDFIFGGGQAHFTNCHLRSLKRADGGVNYLTAASTPQGQSGFVFTNCVIDSQATQPYWLGRPWRSDAKTRYEHCWFGKGLMAPGWGDWENPANQQTVTYEEVDCQDEAAVPRADWIRVHKEEN